MKIIVAAIFWNVCIQAAFWDHPWYRRLFLGILGGVSFGLLLDIALAVDA